MEGLEPAGGSEIADTMAAAQRCETAAANIARILTILRICDNPELAGLRILDREAETQLRLWSKEHAEAIEKSLKIAADIKAGNVLMVSDRPAEELDRLYQSAISGLPRVDDVPLELAESA